MKLKKLLELITNTATGKLSTSDSVLVGAFVISSLVVIWTAIAGTISEWLFCAYLTAWVVQCQASKRAAIDRDIFIKPDNKTEATDND